VIVKRQIGYTFLILFCVVMLLLGLKVHGVNVKVVLYSMLPLLWGIYSIEKIHRMSKLQLGEVFVAVFSVVMSCLLTFISYKLELVVYAMFAAVFVVFLNLLWDKTRDRH